MSEWMREEIKTLIDANKGTGVKQVGVDNLISPLSFKFIDFS
jgi:hypothetical protein